MLPVPREITEFQDLNQLNEWLKSDLYGTHQSSFLEGKSDGYNGEINANVGSLTPCPYYHLGYCIGRREHEFSEVGFYTEAQREGHEFVVEYKHPQWPLSSPASYRVERIKLEA
jgi:hypothetical protein